MMLKIQRYIRDHERVMYFLSSIYRFFMLNRIKEHKGLKIIGRGYFLKKTTIANYGKNNVVEIGKGCRISNCKIQLFENGNTVKIDHDCMLRNLDIWISDGGFVIIGHNTYITGKTHIACIEGKKVTIGERCLFSNDITFRTGDSHSILDMSGKRVNPAEDITIGDHVWIGQQVVILKGANVGSNSIVGTRALLTGKTFEGNTVIGGSPAKVIKSDVTWHHELK